MQSREQVVHHGNLVFVQIGIGCETEIPRTVIELCSVAIFQKPIEAFGPHRFIVVRCLIVHYKEQVDQSIIILLSDPSIEMIIAPCSLIVCRRQSHVGQTVRIIATGIGAATAIPAEPG